MPWFHNLLIETKDGIAIVTICRPKALNASTSPPSASLKPAFTGLVEDKPVRTVGITGSDETAFVAGADVTEIQTMSPAGARDFVRRGQRIFALLDDLPQAVIAAVNGFVLGGGSELAMACDIRIAGENAQFGQPETSLGITA